MLLWWMYFNKCCINRVLNIIFVWEELLWVKRFNNILAFMTDDDACYENGILLIPESTRLK
jgi:hypothetical protein